MQYFKPVEENYFVGDCMPFYHGGSFHLFYLLDEGHHKARNGGGGHQWAHAVTTDLVRWKHHPLAIPIGNEGEYDYVTICTGSVFFHEDTYYAFYATRTFDEAGKQTQRLCMASGKDGIHFVKSPRNPFLSPDERYEPQNFRDPHVFQDAETGLFHMLVSATERQPRVEKYGGCLAHLVSADLKAWELKEPFIRGFQSEPGGWKCPECPDYFYWNGWYYLFISNPDEPTQYCMSRNPLGPWTSPKVNSFDCNAAKVMKTAAYHENRRIGAFFLMSLAGNEEGERWLYGGNAVFREIIQNGDGTLGCKWPEEMIPDCKSPLSYSLKVIDAGMLYSGGKNVELKSSGKISYAVIEEVTANSRLTLKVIPKQNRGSFGLCLRGKMETGEGYELKFSPEEETASMVDMRRRKLPDDPQLLNYRRIRNVEGLEKPFMLDILMKDDIIDVCIDKRRTLITRVRESKGTSLYFHCSRNEVQFEAIEIRPLKA